MERIKKSELKFRSGNFVLRDGEAFRITDQSLEEIMKQKKYPVEGIRITEDWIESFGFFYLASTNKTHTYSYKGIHVHYSDGQVQVFYRQRLIDVVSYVHELQNLFFGITGEELIYRNLLVA
jgi:hypothetical protein